MPIGHGPAAPAVSVVVPARDAAATLARTIDSLRAQTFAAFEAIIVDDASTDETRGLAEALAVRDPRLRVTSLPARAGVGAARNAGLCLARGRWVLFLDADDWIEPGHLASLLGAVEADPGAHGAVSGYRFAAEDGRLGGPIRPRLDQDLFLRTAQRCPFAIHACLVRRDDVLGVGAFDPGLEVGEDWDLWQRLARAGRRFAKAESAGAIYRMRALSAPCCSTRHLEDNLEVIARAHAADPRVRTPRPEHASGRPQAELARNQTPLLLGFVGRRLGRGEGLNDIVDRLVPTELARLSPADIAHQIGSGFLRGAGCLPEDVPGLWPEREAAIHAALEALGTRAGEPGLGGALRLALARHFASRLPPDRLPVTLGELHAIRIRPRDGYRDVTVPPGVRVLQVHLEGGIKRQPLELPVADDVAPAAFLARVVLSARGREISRGLIARHWRKRRTLKRLLRLALGPRGRRFTRHLLTLPGGERGPAIEAFLTSALPSLVPGLRIARRQSGSPSAGARGVPVRGRETDQWEEIFAATDPWQYTSAYEQTKYLQTLELLPQERQLGRALELACAEGHFTIQLAPRVRELLATDISPTALGRAAERCRGVPNVSFQPLDLANNEPLPGRFDLIVASEVFYYLKDKRDLARIARKIADALEPGGLFLTAHAQLAVDDPTTTGFDWPEGFGAATINATFGALRDLETMREIRTPLYRVGLFRKREAAGRAKPTPEILEREASWPESLGVAGQINRGGASLTLRDAFDTLVTRRLPILMYHRIAADGPDVLAPFRVHPKRFEAQLDWLKRNGFRSVGLETWQQAVERGFGELTGRAVCITFDDGYEDFAQAAWPLLQKYGFGATVFLVHDLVGRAAEWDASVGPPAPLMGWDAIGRIAAESRALSRLLGRDSIAFGSHTNSHPALTRVGPERMLDELRRSKEQLEDRLGVEVTSFAYPFGYHDGLARNAVEASGYRTAVTDRDGRARYGDDLLRLPRINVAGTDDLDAFVRKLDLREPAPFLRRLRFARARRRGAIWPGAR